MVSRSEIVISRGTVARNTRRLVDLIAPAELFAVLKANAYGHGATDIARIVLEQGVRTVCVSTLGEGAEIRTRFPEIRVVVLGHTPPDAVEFAVRHRLEIVVGDEHTLAAVPAGLPVHIKIDTALHRWGFSALPGLRGDVVALMGHFAATSAHEADYSKELGEFLAAVSGADIGFLHMCNSNAVLVCPDAHLDAVRSGALLLGLSSRNEDPRTHGFEPALRWTSYVGQVHRIRAGETVGYGRAWTADEDCDLAVIPLGYADGLLKSLPGTTILVAGAPATVVAGVSMDACFARLSRPARAGDPVVIIGDGVSFESHARHIGTLGLELASLVNSSAQRAHRVLVD